MHATEPATAKKSFGYPIRLQIEYPERVSRGLVFVKWLLAIPHILILWALGVAVLVVTIIAFFAILFTKRYPRSLFEFTVGVWRWSMNVAAYILLLRDEYPPFSWEPGKYPVTFEIDYPDEFNRLSPLYKWLLVIPSSLVANALLWGAVLALIPAWFVILITGKLPRIIFDLVVGSVRWYVRTYLYAYLMTDEYPPWTMEASPGATRLAWVVGPIGAILYVAFTVATSLTSGSSSATAGLDLDAGDCIQYGAADEIREVSCVGTYDAEVVGVRPIPGAVYPSEGALLTFGNENAHLRPTTSCTRFARDGQRAIGHSSA